jgi:hypothetical protein
MYCVQRVSDATCRQGPSAARELCKRGGRQDVSSLKRRARLSGQRQEDATVKTAKLAARFLGKPALSGEQRHYAGLAVHYLFGIAAAGLYGVAAEQLPAITRYRGLLFGLALWIFAAELVLPAAGLLEPPQHYAIRDHLNAAVSHSLFGMSTEVARSAILASMCSSLSVGQD